jgi:PAS domain-containing protein
MRSALSARAAKAASWGREPLTDQMAMPKADFLRRELYADWFKPQDFYNVMASPRCSRKAPRRSSSPFAARRSAISRRTISCSLAASSAISAGLGIRLDRERTADELAAAKLTLDSSADAILLVDRNLRVADANAAARAMLEAGKAVRLRAGRLELHDPKADAKLARMAAGARGGNGRDAWREPRLRRRLQPRRGVDDRNIERR